MGFRFPALVCTRDLTVHRTEQLVKFLALHRFIMLAAHHLKETDMLTSILTGKVTELYKGKFKDEDGTEKTYYQLGVYVKGADYPPSFYRLKIKPEQVPEVTPLVGKDCTFEVQQKNYNGKESLHYLKVQ